MGYLRRIKERSRSLLIEFDFDAAIPAIPAKRIVELLVQLDIDKWELNRTHWAVKDIEGWRRAVGAP